MASTPLISLILQKIKASANDQPHVEQRLLGMLERSFIVSKDFEQRKNFEITHTISGVTFVYVPRGRFRVGLSEEELSEAEAIYSPCPISPEEMRPTYYVEIAPFLVAKTPLTNFQAEKLGSPSKDDKNHPAFFARSETETLLQRVGAMAPTEQQWEYFCRAGTQSLFCFGDSLPENSQLEKWLDWDLSSTALAVNNLGIGGLFFGEWCRDHYRSSYAQSARQSQDYVIRGGGAYFWPWQDEEWVWCMSAMRMPSSDLMDGTAVVRPVIEF